jgi:hypothetical protein
MAMAVSLLVLLSCLSARYAELVPEDPVPVEYEWNVETGSVMVCEDPVSSVSYIESGLELGIDTEWFSPTPNGGHEDGPSLAVADANGDNKLDLIVARMSNGISHLYRGSLRDFVDYPGVPGPGRSPLFADINGDNAIDLLLAGPNAAWLEFGYNFEVQQELLALDEGESASVVHDWTLADFDGDQQLEVLAVRTASPFGQGTVTNDRMLDFSEFGPVLARDWVPEAVGLRHGFDALSFDEDNDGDVDVYMVHDHGATVGPSTLLINEGDVFTDAEDTCFCSISASAKGVDIADLDGDGLPELFVTGAPLNTLLSRTEAGWVDRSDVSGVRDGVSHAAGWGAVFFDLGNDGQPDLLLAQGDRYNAGQTDLPDGSPAVFDEPLRLMAYEEGRFTDVAPDLGLDVQGSFRAVMAVDLNSDGVEDFIVTQASQRTLVFLSEGCTENEWVRVDAPVGSVVQVVTESSTHTNWARVGRGFQSTARIPLHFGLGEADAVQEIRVRYGGDEHVAEGPFETRQTITVQGPVPLLSGRE